jgi:hypothetical protein
LRYQSQESEKLQDKSESKKVAARENQRESKQE